MLSKHKRQISMEDYKSTITSNSVQETENGKINEESSNKNANEGRKHSNSVSSTSVFSNKKNDMGEFKQNQNVNSARSVLAHPLRIIHRESYSVSTTLCDSSLRHI